MNLATSVMKCASRQYTQQMDQPSRLHRERGRTGGGRWVGEGGGAVLGRKGTRASCAAMRAPHRGGSKAQESAGVGVQTGHRLQPGHFVFWSLQPCNPPCQCADTACHTTPGGRPFPPYACQHARAACAMAPHPTCAPAVLHMHMHMRVHALPHLRYSTKVLKTERWLYSSIWPGQSNTR